MLTLNWSDVTRKAVTREINISNGQSVLLTLSGAVSLQKQIDRKQNSAYSEVVDFGEVPAGNINVTCTVFDAAGVTGNAVARGTSPVNWEPGQKNSDVKISLTGTPAKLVLAYAPTPVGTTLTLPVMLYDANGVAIPPDSSKIKFGFDGLNLMSNGPETGAQLDTAGTLRFLKPGKAGIRVEYDQNLVAGQEYSTNSKVLHWDVEDMGYLPGANDTGYGAIGITGYDHNGNFLALYSRDIPKQPYIYDYANRRYRPFTFQGYTVNNVSIARPSAPDPSQVQMAALLDNAPGNIYFCYVPAVGTQPGLTDGLDAPVAFMRASDISYFNPVCLSAGYVYPNFDLNVNDLTGRYYPVITAVSFAREVKTFIPNPPTSLRSSTFRPVVGTANPDMLYGNLDRSGTYSAACLLNNSLIVSPNQDEVSELLDASDDGRDAIGAITQLYNADGSDLRHAYFFRVDEGFSEVKIKNTVGVAINDTDGISVLIHSRFIDDLRHTIDGPDDETRTPESGLLLYRKGHSFAVDLDSYPGSPFWTDYQGKSENRLMMRSRYQPGAFLGVTITRQGAASRLVAYVRAIKPGASPTEHVDTILRLSLPLSEVVGELDLPEQAQDRFKVKS